MSTNVEAQPVSAPRQTGDDRAEWLERLIGSDPGLTRLRMALQSVLSIGAILLAELLFISLTHALQTQAHGTPLTAAEAAANHEYLVIGMLLGAIVGMMSSFGVSDATASGQLKTMLFLPFPMVAALAFGIAIGGYRIAALISLAVVLSVGTYLRRFGPRGFIAGMLLFMGDFFGFFLHGAVTMSDIGWLTAEIGVGLLVAMIIRFALFYPRPAKALARIQRSYAARARRVAALTLELFDNPERTDRDVRRLHRRLIRLNEAALMIDAQLGDPSALAEGSSAQLMHQRLFDVELALTNVARFAQAIAEYDLPPSHRAHVRATLLAISSGDFTATKSHGDALLELIRQAGPGVEGDDRTSIVLAHRFAGSAIDLADAITDWNSFGVAADGESTTFQPSVALASGWLPGSSQVSAAASAERGIRSGERITLAPYTRTAIQMGVAVGAAIALGDVLSGQRFYWAVIAAFVTFMGANNSGEQIRKASFRVVGTLVGIGVGSLIVRIVGHHTNYSIAVIMIALFFGFYLMRINYAFMVIGITVMISQLYVQLDEFSESLLLLRLEETALGAAIAITVVTLVLPLRTSRVLRVALREHVRAVATLVEHAGDQLLGRGDSSAVLRSDARSLDASFQALVATNVPLGRDLFRSVDEDNATAMRLAAAARNYARNLVADVEGIDLVDTDTGVDLQRATDTLKSSLEVLASALTGSRDVTYVRSASLFDRAERRLEQGANAPVDGPQLALRDLKLIDGTMATLATAIKMTVVDYDTTVADTTDDTDTDREASSLQLSD